MSLLLQLNGDLPEYFPHDERRLHILTCRKKQCSRKVGSIRAVREVRKHRSAEVAQTKEEKPSSNPETTPESKDLGATLFGTTSPVSKSSNPNPFSISSQPSSIPPNPFGNLLPTSSLAAKSPQPPEQPPIETFASKLRISSSPSQSKHSLSAVEPWPSDSAFPKPFPHLHLDADYEYLASEQPPISKASTSGAPAQYTGEDTTATNGLDKDLFESSFDKTFLRFSDRLAQNPEQVLRYEWKGTPLLYSSTDAVGKRLTASNTKTKARAARMPGCDSCGAERVFEMQLVPGTIATLEEDEVNLEEGMEWGTIIVGVCGRNCGEVGEVIFREEWCGVQWEERD